MIVPGKLYFHWFHSLIHYPHVETAQQSYHHSSQLYSSCQANWLNPLKILLLQQYRLDTLKYSVMLFLLLGYRPGKLDYQ